MKSYHIITDKALKKIFLFNKNNEFYLPSYNIKKISNASKKLKELTGLDTNILYPAISDYEKDFFVFVSICNFDDLKDKKNFFEIENLPNFDLKEIVLEWAKYKDKNFNLPWFNVGWFEQTKQYLKDKYGYKKVELFYLSSISCVLRIKLKDKNIFYKQVLKGLFEQEIIFTKILNEISDNVPSVIDYDNSNGYLILEDFGSKTLWDFNDVDTWCKTIKKYAQLQKSALKNIDKIKKVLLFDRSISNLYDIFESLTSNPDNFYLNKSYGITNQEYQELLSFKPKIKDLCQKLSSFNIPNTIEHGDMHPFNIAMINDKPIFYDWSDCSISHPFFTIRALTYAFFDKKGNELKKVSFIKECDYPYQKIVKAYLEEWEDFESKENLIDAFKISRILVDISFIHQYNLLINSMEEHTKHVFLSYISKGTRRLIRSINSIIDKS
jgi:hypothetical protein